MSRSGVDREPARALVQDLEKMSANVLVLKGDVGNAGDVEKGFAQIKDPIGGVVQAAMGLSVCSYPFFSMSGKLLTDITSSPFLRK
jgi:hypothetical protein